MSAHDAPLVVQTAEVPSDYLKQAHERGEIRLRVWKPSPGENATAASREWVLENVPGATALVVLLQTKVDAELLDRAGPSLQVVSTMSVGYDHIDVAACKQRHVRVGYTPGVLTGAVADTTVMLVLMTMRHALTASRLVASGRWPMTPIRPLTLTGPCLAGKTIGFLGFGDIAQTTARRLFSFEPKRIVYTTSKPKPFDVQSETFRPLVDDVLKAFHQVHGRLPVEVENVPDLCTMAAESDVLIVLANYTPSTHHRINAEVLRKMKPSAYLVNIARGPLVDTDALVQALRHNELAGAALDVVEGEPQIASGHPLLAQELEDKVVLLPHIGSATVEARRAMGDYAELNALGAMRLRKDGDPGAMSAELDIS